MFYVERPDTGKVWDRVGERWTFTTLGLGTTHVEASWDCRELRSQGHVCDVVDSTFHIVPLASQEAPV